MDEPVPIHRSNDLKDVLAWIAAVVMASALAAWGIWGALFDPGRSVSDDRLLGIVPRLLDRKSRK